MQPVFNALFIWLFICIYTGSMVNAATLWPGLFAQSVLRTPVFWPTPYHGASEELAAANLQQSESSGHLLGSAEHHMISSEDPIPSGLFIPVDQLHRELFNSPHLLRKHSPSHFPAYHQFALNHFHHHHPNKKLIASTKHHKTAYPTLSPKFKSLHKTGLTGKKKSHKDEFAYLDDDFYTRNSNLFNLNAKLNGQLLSEYADYGGQDLELGKPWPKRPAASNDQDQTNSLINTTEEHAYEDDLFTIKNNAATEPPTNKANNGGRIDLRKSNPKRKLQHLKDLKDMRDLKEYRDTKNVKDIREFKEMRDLKEIRELKELRDAKEKELRDLKELKELKEAKDGLESKETKDPKLTNENRYIENYDGRNNLANSLASSAASDAPSEKFSEKYSQPEHRNIERYNLEKFFQNEKFNHQANRNDGRILISNNNFGNNANNNGRKEKSVFKNYKNPNGELSVISETIYQNHQLKSDNRRSPASRLVLMQNHDRQYEPDRDRKQPANGNNESITIQTNPNLPTNDTGDDQSDDKDAPLGPHKNEPKPSHKIELLNEEQMNQQLFGTTWNAQRIIPTPQISYMQSMFTESNTVATNGGDQASSSSKGTYSSERSQLNNQSNHFSSLAIWAIIVCSLIAALLFTGSSLFLMYKVSQIKRRRLMRFQETANRNQFEAAFPVQTSSCKTARTGQASLDSGPSSNSLSNNIISNNNFIRQQKSLFSNLNARCNAGKTMLSIKEQLDGGQNFAVKKPPPGKTATINKAASKHLNLAIGNRECYVTQIKTASDQKNSALSRLLSKMTSQQDENKSDSDSPLPPVPPPPTQQRVSFF